MRLSSALGVTSSALLVCVVASLSAEPARVPGTRVALDPPDGFVPSTQFAGFQSTTPPASIMVTELPGPAATMKRGMTRSALAGRGMTLLASTTETVDGHSAVLLQVRQTGPAGDVLKWMLIAGGESRTVMIVGTYPADEAVVGEAIRRVLMGAELGTRTNAPDVFEGLNFTVTPSRRLKVAGRVGNLLALTETGTMAPTDNPDAALYFVGHSLGPVPVGDLEQFSATRLRQTTRIKGLTNQTGHSMSLGGLAAYQLEADTSDARTGRPVHIYQVIAPDDAGYFIVQGLVSPARAVAMVAEFEQITATFQRARD